jgi:hypothetical protein
MSHLHRRIDRLEGRRIPDLLAMTLLAEDPTPGAPALERRGGILTARVGAGVNLHADEIVLLFSNRPQADSPRFSAFPARTAFVGYDRSRGQ